MKPCRLRVALYGFEPAIQHSLESLLSAEPGVEIVHLARRWSPGEDVACEVPDVLVAVPPSVSWVDEVYKALPGVRVLVMVDWQVRDQFAGSPVAGIFDRFQGYHGLLEMVLDQQDQ